MQRVLNILNCWSCLGYDLNKNAFDVFCKKIIAVGG